MDKWVKRLDIKFENSSIFPNPFVFHIPNDILTVFQTGTSGETAF